MPTNDAHQQANRAEMDPRRMVVITLLIAIVVLGVGLGHAIGPLFARFNIGSSQLVEGVGLSLADVVGFFIAVGLGVYAWTNARTHNYAMEVATELMRVTWPTAAETRASTAAVVVASIVAGVLLFALDSVSYRVMINWLPALWGKL